MFFRKNKKENSCDSLSSKLDKAAKDNVKESSKKKSSSKKKIPMIKKTIEHLPNIVLVSILTVVSDEYHECIADYRLVCKLWGEMITKSVPVRINFNKTIVNSKQSPLGFYHVHRTIVKFSKITYLSFRGNRSLDVDLLLDLFSGSQKRFSDSLVHLDIGKMCLEQHDSNKMQLINRVLVNFPNLMVLDISDNEISNQSLGLFIDNLAAGNHSLISLNISLNPIGDDGCKLLGERVFKDSINCNIKFLNIRGCAIQGNGLEQLLFDSETSSLYSKIHKLHSLLVGHNGGIGVGGATTLGKLLSRNTSVQYLDLEYCGLGVDGFNELATPLSETTSLVYIDLSNNRLDVTDTTKSFEERIEKNRDSKLKFIETSMNKWSYEKRKSNSNAIQLPMVCLKHYDLRYLLVDCLNSLTRKGCYNPIKFKCTNQFTSSTLPKSE